MITTSTLHKSKDRKTLFILFVLVGVAWLILDRITKTVVESSYALGEVFSRDVLGLFQFEIVHNTGAAWGSFSSSTLFLAILSLAICLAIIVIAWRYAHRATALEMIGLALIAAGGIGNVTDRLAYGYVIDFITPTCIDFPTFNVADIGVTCGIIIVIIAYSVQTFAKRKA